MTPIIFYSKGSPSDDDPSNWHQQLLIPIAGGLLILVSADDDCVRFYVDGDVTDATLDRIAQVCRDAGLGTDSFPNGMLPGWMRRIKPYYSDDTIAGNRAWEGEIDDIAAMAADADRYGRMMTSGDRSEGVNRLLGLDRQAAALRKQLNIADSGTVLLRHELWDGEYIEVRASGYGGARVVRAKSIGGGTDLVKSSNDFDDAGYAILFANELHARAKEE